MAASARITRTLLSFSRRTALPAPRPVQCIPRTLPSAAVVRTFTSTPITYKKKDKNASTIPDAPRDKKGGKGSVTPAAGGANELEALEKDFKKLDTEGVKIMEKLVEDLQKLKAGRANPALLENLDVVLEKGDKKKTKLKDLAHVVAKGRGLAVTVYEVGNVKKLISAIQTANLNVTPVADANNVQLINVPLPPPTKESRTEAAKEATKAGQKAQDGVQSARAALNKKLQGIRKAHPDDYKKMDKRMEEAVRKIKADVEKKVKEGSKAIMEG